MRDELIFKASLKKALLLFLGCICFVVLGAWMITEKSVLGWLCVGFFGLGIPVSLLMMRPNTTYLRLDQEGFEIVAMSRRSAFKWTEVEGFHVGKMHGTKMIGIVFSPECTKQQAARAFASSIAGIEGAIADHYITPIEEVCKIMNEWKIRYDSKAI